MPIRWNVFMIFFLKSGDKSPIDNCVWAQSVQKGHRDKAGSRSRNTYYGENYGIISTNKYSGTDRIEKLKYQQRKHE